MSVTIPLRNDLTDFSLSVVLDGKAYALAFIWNLRSEEWLMNISDASGNLLAAGWRVVVDFPIARRLQDARLPPGMFQAYDTAGQHRDPQINDLGTRVLLTYLTQAEIQAAGLTA